MTRSRRAAGCRQDVELDIACPHQIPNGSSVWIGVTQPPSYLCVFCEVARLNAEIARLNAEIAHMRPPKPVAVKRCQCTHEQGDSVCEVHPGCDECGERTERPVKWCAEHIKAGAVKP